MEENWKNNPPLGRVVVVTGEGEGEGSGPLDKVYCIFNKVHVFLNICEVKVFFFIKKNLNYIFIKINFKK